jgi:hypothetical protein
VLPKLKFQPSYKKQYENSTTQMRHSAMLKKYKLFTNNHIKHTHFVLMPLSFQISIVVLVWYCTQHKSCTGTAYSLHVKKSECRGAAFRGLHVWCPAQNYVRNLLTQAAVGETSHNRNWVSVSPVTEHIYTQNISQDCVLNAVRST